MIEALRAASAATKVDFTIVILELRAEMQMIQLANGLIDWLNKCLMIKYLGLDDHWPTNTNTGNGGLSCFVIRYDWGIESGFGG